MADETGFLMNPSVKKTWAPRARTPVVPYRKRRHQKVSVIGAAVLHTARGRVDLACDFYPDSYVRGPEAAAFLRRLLNQYPDRPIDVVWDNLGVHKCKLVKQVAAEHPRLTLHYLPPYAPELNPVEGVWCLTKHHRMANHAIADLDTLHARAKRHLDHVAARPDLLAACFKHAGLALYLHSAQ